LEFDDRMTTEARLKIQHVDDFRLDRVVPSSPSIQIVDSREVENGVELQIRVSGISKEQPAEGDALQVFVEGDSTQPALLIPIRSRRSSAIGYVPQRLDFPQFDAEPVHGSKIQRVVAVVIPPDRLAQDAHVKILVPWARIVTETSEGSILRLEVEFDCRDMPDEFHQAILSAQLSDQQANQELFANGYRAKM
jgi:hypothetical protein